MVQTLSPHTLEVTHAPRRPCYKAILCCSGKGFCLDLAKKGMNIVLVSRSKDKLDTVAKEIEEKYAVKTKVIAIDFTKDKDVREEIETGIKVGYQKSISLLLFPN